MSSPRLTTVTRQRAARSSHADAARTTDGPPPSTDGMRWDSAPKSSCAAKPTATTAATTPYPSASAAHEPLVARRHPTSAIATTHHPRAAVTDHVANTFGGAFRAGATSARPHQSSPTT